MQRLDLGPVDLRELLTGMGDLLERSLGPAVRLHVEFQPGPCVAMADTNQLELAIVNLAVNARDAMPDGGRLTIRVEEVDFGAALSDLGPGRYWRIAVADTGVGMSLETRQRAFEPFYTTKGMGKGTGLGLSQVYGIARQSGGTAIIDSVADKGTTVSILLPRTEGKPQPDAFVAALMPSVEPVKQSREETLLVVDDDVDVRRFLVASVTAMGYRVIEAANGHEALEVLDGGLRPNLMILDFAMPGMNGAEVAAEALRRLPGIRILIATGYADTKALQGAIGALPMLRKPFLVADLAKAIEGELRRAPN